MILSIWPAADQVIFVLRNSYFGPFSWSLKIENLTNFISINWQYYLSTSDWSRRTLNRLLHIEWWIEMMWTRLVRRGNRLNNIIIAIVNVFPIEANRKVKLCPVIEQTGQRSSSRTYPHVGNLVIPGLDCSRIAQNGPFQNWLKKPRLHKSQEWRLWWLENTAKATTEDRCTCAPDSSARHLQVRASCGRKELWCPGLFRGWRYNYILEAVFVVYKRHHHPGTEASHLI